MQKEIIMSLNKCPKCGSDQIDSGHVVSAGIVEYRTARTRSPFKTGKCQAYACLDCGYVELYVDPEYRGKVREMPQKIVK